MKGKRHGQRLSRIRMTWWEIQCYLTSGRRSRFQMFWWTGEISEMGSEIEVALTMNLRIPRRRQQGQQRRSLVGCISPSTGRSTGAAQTVPTALQVGWRRTPMGARASQQLRGVTRFTTPAFPFPRSCCEVVPAGIVAFKSTIKFPKPHRGAGNRSHVKRCLAKLS